ncbi:FAD-binding domain containing protein [Rhabdaerophilaceae bacterium]
MTKVVIGGGGPSGLALAALLASRGCETIVIDPLRPLVDRLELLAPSLWPVLRRAGIDGLLEDPSIARDCLGISQQWDGLPKKRTDFLRHPFRLGKIVQRSKLRDLLAVRARTFGVTFIAARAMRTDIHADGVRISTDCSQSTLISADLVVDATGRAAQLSRRLGARQVMYDPQIAVRISNFFAQDDAVGPVWLTSHKRSGDHAWTYSVAGPAGASEVWRVGPTDAFGNVDRSTEVDASTRIIAPAAGARWLAIGDASASFDPLASQGLAHAFGTALAAAGLIISGRYLSETAMNDYATAVSVTAAASLAAKLRTDFLANFSTAGTKVSWL